MVLLLRLVRWLMAPLLATGLVLGGGGWYVAGQIGDRALALHPYAPRTPLTVVAVHRASIRLRGRLPELTRPGTYGVYWTQEFGAPL